MNKKLRLLWRRWNPAWFPVILGLVLAAMPSASSWAVAPAAAQPAATQPASRARTHLDNDGVLAFLKQFEPEVYEGALVIKAKDPAKYDQLLKEVNADVCMLVDLQKRNQPLFEVTLHDRLLGYKAFQLAKELRDSVLTAEVRQARIGDLHQVLTEQFINRQKKREMELTDLQTKLDELKTELEDRQMHQEDLINQRINDLMDKTPKVDW